jgi:hypothetical protein
MESNNSNSAKPKPSEKSDKPSKPTEKKTIVLPEEPKIRLIPETKIYTRKEIYGY